MQAALLSAKTAGDLTRADPWFGSVPLKTLFEPVALSRDFRP